MLELGNIKFAAFISDVFGTSGMALLQSVINGEVLDAEQVRKKKSSRIPKGKRMLKAVLCQCAWSASMTKSSRIRAFFDRIVKR